jgi:hypothetical protein
MPGSMKLPLLPLLLLPLCAVGGIPSAQAEEAGSPACFAKDRCIQTITECYDYHSSMGREAYQVVFRDTVSCVTPTGATTQTSQINPPKFQASSECRAERERLTQMYPTCGFSP